MGVIIMRQFNLEEYLKNPSRKVVTRNGKNVRIICTDAKFIRPIVALIESNGADAIQFYYPNGKTTDSIGILAALRTPIDLFFAPKKRDRSKFRTPVKRFDPKDFKPFDKVLVKGLSCNSKVWAPCFLEEFKKFSDGSGAVVLIGFISYIWQRCIPYNDETMHLVNTEKDCPEYYKWWEDLCQK